VYSHLFDNDNVDWDKKTEGKGKDMRKQFLHVHHGESSYHVGDSLRLSSYYFYIAPVEQGLATPPHLVRFPPLAQKALRSRGRGEEGLGRTLAGKEVLPPPQSSFQSLLSLFLF